MKGYGYRCETSRSYDSEVRRQTSFSFLFSLLIVLFFSFFFFPPDQGDDISFQVAECDRDTFIWASVSINVAAGIN